MRITKQGKAMYMCWQGGKKVKDGGKKLGVEHERTGECGKSMNNNPKI